MISTTRILCMRSASEKRDCSCKHWALPHREQADHGEWHGHKAEIEPGAVSARILGTLEKLKAKPEADSKTEEQAYEIARGVVGRPDGLVLGHADAQGQHH